MKKMPDDEPSFQAAYYHQCQATAAWRRAWLTSTVTLLVFLTLESLLLAFVVLSHWRR